MAKSKAVKERQKRLLELVNKYANDNKQTLTDSMEILSKEMGYAHKNMLHTYAYSKQTISARALELLEFKIASRP